MTEAPAFHLGCGGRLSFGTDLFGNTVEMCDRCNHSGLVGTRSPTAADNGGKSRHHGQGIHPKRGPGRHFPPPKGDTK